MLTAVLFQVNMAPITSAKIRSFTVKIVLPSGDRLEISEVAGGMTVKMLKDRIELKGGIPGYVYNSVFMSDQTDSQFTTYVPFGHLLALTCDELRAPTLNGRTQVNASFSAK